MKVPAGMGTIPGLHVCFATGAGRADGAALGERLGAGVADGAALGERHGAGFAHAARPSPATIVPARIRARMVGTLPNHRGGRNTVILAP